MCEYSTRDTALMDASRRNAVVRVTGCLPVVATAIMARRDGCGHVVVRASEVW